MASSRVSLGWDQQTKDSLRLKDGKGGQGIVYSAPKLRTAHASSLVYKEYHPHVKIDVAALEAMPAFLESLPATEGLELLGICAWPCRLVVEGSRVSGFLMPRIPAIFFHPMRMASGAVRREPCQAQHFLNSRQFLANRGIELPDERRYLLINDVAKGLDTFHRHQISVGDLSPRNLLFSLGAPTAVYFIDCDSMRLRGRCVMPQVETPDWEVRSVNPQEQLGTSFSDSYKLGLLALRILAGHQSTRDPSSIASLVPQEIYKLVTKSLSSRPSERPTPKDWSGPLLRAASSAEHSARQRVAPKLSVPAPRVLPRSATPPRSVAVGLPWRSIGWVALPAFLLGVLLIGGWGERSVPDASAASPEVQQIQIQVEPRPKKEPVGELGGRTVERRPEEVPTADQTTERTEQIALALSKQWANIASIFDRLSASGSIGEWINHAERLQAELAKHERYLSEYRQAGGSDPRGTARSRWLLQATRARLQLANRLRAGGCDRMPLSRSQLARLASIAPDSALAIEISRCGVRAFAGVVPSLGPMSQQAYERARQDEWVDLVLH